MSGERRGLVIVNNEVQLQVCSLYISQWHHVPILDLHHIAPESWWIAAGKDVSQSQKIALCSSCHSSTHAAIDAIIKKQITDLLPPRCYQLALQAFQIAEANGLTPALTL